MSSASGKATGLDLFLGDGASKGVNFGKLELLLDKKS